MMGYIFFTLYLQLRCLIQWVCSDWLRVIRIVLVFLKDSERFFSDIQRLFCDDYQFCGISFLFSKLLWESSFEWFSSKNHFMSNLWGNSFPGVPFGFYVDVILLKNQFQRNFIFIWRFIASKTIFWFIESYYCFWNRCSMLRFTGWRWKRCHWTSNHHHRNAFDPPPKFN